MIKKKKNIFRLLTLSMIGIFALPLVSFAQILVPQVAGLGTADIKTVAGTLIQVFLGLLGLIALVIVLVAGFKWMTSGGNEEKVSEAKKMLIAGVIGLVIIMASYVITSFILDSIQGAIDGPGEDDQTCSVGVCYTCNRCDSDGDLIYDNTCPGCNNSIADFNFRTNWYSPQSNNVSLCSMIQIKFNANLDQDYFNDNIKPGSTPIGTSQSQSLFHFYECLEYADNQCVKVSDDLVENSSQFTINENILQFRLGEDYAEDTYYVVDLPLKGIKQEGESKYLSNNLTWTFKTGKETDINPPTVINVFPGPEGEVCLNSYIEIEFSEDMDLNSLKDLEAFRLYENIPDNLSDIEFLHSVQNDKLIVHPDRNYNLNHNYFPVLNGDVIKDTCGNLLDGDFDGKSEYAPTDDYPTNGPSVAWNFKTGENEYCQPQITGVTSETYYDDDSPLTITGHYLSGGTTLVFNDDLVIDENSNLCLNDSYWPDDLCAAGTWEVNEINTFIPADGGDSFGVIAEKPSIKIQTDQGSTEENFALLSPRIVKISPDRGGKGQYISVLGNNFDEFQDINFAESKIFFRSESDEYLEADLPCDKEGWKNNSIVITAPEGLEVNSSYRIQIKKVLVNDVEYWSNLGDYYYNEEDAGPGLCSINKETIEYEDEFILDGFKLGDSNIERRVVLGDDYNSTSAPTINWGDPVDGQDTRVVAQAPNLASADDIGVRVAVEIDGELRFSNYLNVDVLSDFSDQFYISYISPEVASVGEYITIYGSGFGNSQGDQTVRFYNNTFTWPEGDFNFPEACSSVYWQDDQIIVKVPEIFTTLPFESQIKVVNDQIETAAVAVEIDDEDPAPSICSVNPELGTLGDELEIIGEYLNDVDWLTFAYETDDALDIRPNSTNKGVVEVSVPETNTGLISAHNTSGYGNTWNFEYQKVEEGPAEEWDFYGWEFTTCTQCESPRVRVQSCDAELKFSPSPAPGNKFVPLGSNVYIEFEYQDEDPAEMNIRSYQNNFNIYECSDGDAPLELEYCNELKSFNSVEANTFLEINTLDFQAGYWYRGELLDEIKDIEGSSLNEYSWYFRIDPYGAICEPDTLNIEPNNFVKTYVANDTLTYTGLLVDSENCYVCASDGYDYDWESSDTSLATIANNNTSETDVTLNDYYNFGNLEIRATSTLDTLELADDTNLYIVANCSIYEDSTTCHDSGECCWDGETCGSDMSVCDEDCLVYTEVDTCEADTCCWANEECLFENNPDCGLPIDCSIYEDSKTCHESGECCWDSGDIYSTTPEGGICSDDMTACDEDCLVYKEVETCEADACCWANEECLFENNSACDFEIEDPEVDPVLDDLMILSNYPRNESSNICPNTLIKVEFDLPVDADSLEGNIELLESSSFGSAANIDFTYSSYRRYDGTSVLEIIPQGILDSTTIYQVNLLDGENGIKSNEGGGLSCDSSSNGSINNGRCDWSFTTAANVCDLSYVKIVNPVDNYYEFNTPMIGETFIAEARTISGDPIVSVAGVYDWQWKWESFDESLVTLAGDNSDSVLVMPANNNGTTIVEVNALQIPSESICNDYSQASCEINSCCWVDGVCSANLETCEENLLSFAGKSGYKGITLSDEVEVELFMCENSWAFEDRNFNFKFKYCRDGGLPYLADSLENGLIINDFEAVEGEDSLLREYIFKYIPDPNQQANSGNYNLVDAKSNNSLMSEVGISGLADNQLGFKFLSKIFRGAVSYFSNNRVLAATPSGQGILPNDILGLRIYQNKNHYSPIAWYSSTNVVNFKGSPNPISINGYQGLKDGRTTYVNAANKVDNSIYTNISLISHNQDAILETVNIFNQLVDNWKFNINMRPDSKSQLIEDVQRWEDLRRMESNLDNYAAQNKYCAYVSDPVAGACGTYPIQYYHFDLNGNKTIDSAECYNVSATKSCSSDSECQNNDMGYDQCVGVYPELNEGTYVQGISTSAWPSWNSTLANQMGTSLPIDPVNEFNSCSASYDQQTCWDVEGQTFSCPRDSHIYYYQASNSNNIDKRALSFNLYSLFNFNTKNDSYWNGSGINRTFNSAINSFNSLNLNNYDVCNDQVSATCGNGIKELGEECEYGQTLSLCSNITHRGYYNPTEVGCRYDCQWPAHINDPEDCLSCGDGVFSPEYGEVCELGQSEMFCEDSWNPQEVSCVACQWPDLDECEYCGDGVCDIDLDNNGVPFEGSDPGEDNFCYQDCEDGCGDGICDHEFEDAYSCYIDCGDCGDEIVSGWEECDLNIGEECLAGDYGGHYQCINSGDDECTWSDECTPDGNCGDGVVNGNELCEINDIGPQCERNTDAYWGNRECIVTTETQPYNSEDCFWHLNTEEDNIWCPTDESCGDGAINGLEECDDGNNANEDGCDSNCLLECGNGEIEPLEECDDGNNVNEDGCDSNCLFECGNSQHEYWEVCDEGSYNNDDCSPYYQFEQSGHTYCQTDCLSECTVQGNYCGDGIVQSSYEDCDTPGLLEIYTEKKMEIVFIFDMTSSMGDAATELCGALGSVASDLYERKENNEIQDYKITVMTLGDLEDGILNNNPNDNIIRTDGNNPLVFNNLVTNCGVYQNLNNSSYPEYDNISYASFWDNDNNNLNINLPSDDSEWFNNLCGPNGQGDTQEHWGYAVEKVATNYNWENDYQRIIIPVSDEAAYCGNDFNDYDDYDESTSNGNALDGWNFTEILVDTVNACNNSDQQIYLNPVLINTELAGLYYSGHPSYNVAQAIADDTGGVFNNTTDNWAESIISLVDHLFCDGNGDGYMDCFFSGDIQDVCTSWTYSAWSECINGQQTRSILSSSPDDCINGNSILTQNCDVCVSWTYSAWSECINGQQTREVLTSYPYNCIDGDPVLTQNCAGEDECANNYVTNGNFSSGFNCWNSSTNFENMNTDNNIFEVNIIGGGSNNMYFSYDNFLFIEGETYKLSFDYDTTSDLVLGVSSVSGSSMPIGVMSSYCTVDSCEWIFTASSQQFLFSFPPNVNNQTMHLDNIEIVHIPD
jgi:cysteine-rich repeat protein